MKRTGARGENSFQRIGWDEALDTLAARLRDIAARFGPQAVCLYTGRGTFEQSLWEMLSPAGVRETCAWSLLFPFGSPNTTGAGSNCYVSHAVLAPVTTFGTWWADTSPDLESARLIVVWGTNPANASPPELMRRIERAAKRGAEVVVIDHRRTETAQRVDAEWLAVRPGTDGALALVHDPRPPGGGPPRPGVRRAVDPGFRGAPRIRPAASPRKRPQRITGIPAEAIRRTARAIARPGGTTLLSYTGLEYTTSGVQNIRAVMTLWALSGNLDVPGREPDPDAGRGFPGERVPADRAARNGVEPVGKGDYPLYHRYRKEAHAMEIPRAILEDDPYPVRGMLVWGASIITGYPDPALWRRAFSALDFLVGRGQVPHGGLPLRGPHPPRRHVVRGGFLPGHGRPRGASTEGHRAPGRVAERLADRGGHRGAARVRRTCIRGPHREMLRWAFEGTSVDLEELEKSPDGVRMPAVPMRYRKWESGLLRADGTPGFETPSGKFEIASAVLAEHGYDALPVYAPPREGPEGSPALTGAFPLVFDSGARNKAFFCSQHHNVPRSRAAETASAGLDQPA